MTQLGLVRMDQPSSCEQLSSLRLVPDLDVWRPADTQETAAGWIAALTSTERPLAFALSRQTLHEIPKPSHK